MSVGVFIGIRASFNDQAAASAFLSAIDRALRLARLPVYGEPVALFDTQHRVGLGRSDIDHQGAGVLAGLGSYGRAVTAEHLMLIENNPHRVAFLPFDFRSPVETEYCEAIGGNLTKVWVGSTPALHRELCAVAPALGVPLEGGILSDHTAILINEGRSLDAGDEEPELLEDERTAWLLLYEGTRLAIERGVALSLAG